MCDVFTEKNRYCMYIEHKRKKLQTNEVAMITSYIGIHPSINASPAAVIAEANTDPSFSSTKTFI